MSDKKGNQGPKGINRREAITGIGVLLASILAGGSAEADNRANQNVTRSRVAQELNRAVELIGQAEMKRLVSCHNIISAHLLNPLFLQMISKVDATNNTFVINQEVVDALLLAIENPYDLSYEIDLNDGADRNIIIKKRTPGNEGNIPDGFKIRIDMVAYSDIGHVVKVNDGGEVNEKLDPSHMDYKKITDIVSHHNSVINAELKTSIQVTTERDKINLPNPLKKMFMLLNVIIPRHIADVMRARNFNEASEYGTPGLFGDFISQEELQRNGSNSYNDFIENNDNWRLELNALRDKPGFYRIAMDTDNEIDISLDGYILDANEQGAVIPDSRNDNRKWQLAPMYYKNIPNDPDGKQEHLLKHNYYQQKGNARGKR